MIADLIKANRSCRRFYENERIDEGVLKELIDLARFSGSAANLQPLKYIISSKRGSNEKIFSTLGWAAYLKDWNGPEKGERPASYIIILLDTRISNNKWSIYDCGIAGQSILLGAVEKGFAGCMIGSINKKKLSMLLKIPTYLEIMLIIALGKPAEKVVIETVENDKDIKYFRDRNGIHHVPKRRLEDIIITI